MNDPAWRHTRGQAESKEAETRPSMTPQQIESWADQAIKQAQRRGDFDNLPGAGKPLQGLDRPYDPNWWVKGLLERERLDMTAVMPGVMALRRERQGFPETLLGLPGEDAVRAHLEDFNERVLADRRKPYFGTGSPMVAGRVDVEEMLGRWRELRDRARREARQAAAQAPPAAEQGEKPGGRRRWWRGSRARSGPAEHP